MQLGPAEILVVLVIALLVFGPTRLPEVGRQVGRAVKELRKFQHTVTKDIHEVFDADEATDATHAAEPPPTLPPREEAAKQSPEAIPPAPSAESGESAEAGEKADGS